MAAEAAGGPRARARCVVRVSRHGATLSPRPALGACQPCPSMIHARARACSDDGCLRLTARTRKRGSTHIGQWQSHAHGRHGLSSCARPMHVPHDAQPLNLPVRAQNSQVGHRGRHAAERRRHEVDIGFSRSGGWIEWLGLLSCACGSGSGTRFMHLFTTANELLVTVYAHTERSAALSRYQNGLLNARAPTHAVWTPCCITLSSAMPANVVS